MLGFLWLLIISVTASASLQCSEDVRSVKGNYLTGHVVSNGSAAGIGDCLVECSSDPRCKSINFRFKDLLCELSDADRYTHPADYKPSEEHAYSDYPYKATFTELYITPLWLEAHASYIDKNHFTIADQITFNPGSLNKAAILKVPLASADVLTDGSPLTVGITVANDVSIGQAFDSDIIYGVSDGTNFIGFTTVDKGNYGTHSPCYGTETRSGATITGTSLFAPKYPIPRYNSYPDKFVFTLKLDRSWGSCFIAHGDGFTKTAEYTKRLVLSHGLTLEVYKNDARERVGIKYINVTIRKTV